MTFTVRVQGRAVKTFKNKKDAQEFMVKFVEVLQLQQKQIAYVDEAVLKSDLSEANNILKHIMEKK
jgi:hypothetical protein